MKRFSILLIVLASIYDLSWSQISVSMAYRRETVGVKSEVPVEIVNPREGIFSTRTLSDNYPSSKIPVEDIKVSFPDLSGTLDTVGILWYLKPESYSQKGEVNIILVTIDADSIKRYYIDNNNDRIFNSDEKKFIFRPNEESIVVEIRILGNYYDYTLMNPDYIAPVSTPSRLAEYSDEWKKYSKKPSLNLDISFITGGGDGSISFVPSLEAVDRYEYRAKLVGSFRPSIGLDLSWFNFHIIGFTAYERIQYDETVLYAFKSTYKNGKTRYYQRSEWPSSRYYYGLIGEYDIRLGKLYITPTASYSKYKNINEVPLDWEVDVPPEASYKNTSTKELGVKIKVPISFRTNIYLKYLYSTSNFDATDYIVPYVDGTCKVDYHQNLFGIGLQVKVF
ncbi:MAG: hypothetical protein U0X39_09230 [Bacteroidales bacterium]